MSGAVLHEWTIPPLIQALHQCIPAVILPVESLVQIHLDPVDRNRGVRQLQPTSAKELIQLLLIVDGEVQARAIAEKLLAEVPFVVILHQPAGSPRSSTAMLSITVCIQP